MLFSLSFLTMSFANFFTVASFASFFLFPLFIANHGGSKADIGIVMGAMALSAVFCRPWISEMIDRIGRKRSYTFGSLIVTAVPLIYLTFHGNLSSFYLPLLLVRIVQGVGLATCFTAAFTYIADIIPEKRLNEGIGMFGVSALTGIAIGPAFSELIIQQFGFSIFFLTVSAMAAVGLLIHLPLPESYVNCSSQPASSFFSVLKRRRSSTAAMLAILFGFGLAATGTFVSLFAEERNLPLISLYFISYSSTAILTRLLGGRLADKVGEERIIPYALIVTATGLFIMIFLGGSTILVLSGLLTGCGHGFLFPALNTLAIRNEPIAIRGKVVGVFTGGIDAGVFLGSVILGYIGDWVGFRALFFAAGLALLLGLCVLKVRSAHFDLDISENLP